MRGVRWIALLCLTGCGEEASPEVPKQPATFAFTDVTEA